MQKANYRNAKKSHYRNAEKSLFFLFIMPKMKPFIYEMQKINKMLLSLT